VNVGSLSNSRGVSRMFAILLLYFPVAESHSQFPDPYNWTIGAVPPGPDGRVPPLNGLGE
jgi:hypothetical protein